MGFEEAYEAVAFQIGNPPDREENPGRGCIDPARTAAGLVETGERIEDVAGSGGRLIFATGHPGAMILYYLGLSRWAQELGGDVLTVETRGRYERGVSLDWAESVATLGDGASLFHTHDPKPMRDVLQQTGPVDLVVADHGFAGAAIAAGVPTIVVMDTNDPAFAVVAGRGADVTVVPMDDNRPLNAYSTALDVVRKIRGEWEKARSNLLPPTPHFPSDYFGAIRIAPSSLMTSPLSISFSMMCFTRSAYSSGFPRREGKGTCFPRIRGLLRAGRPSSGCRRCRGRWS